jgi:hypothetical protein
MCNKILFWVILLLISAITVQEFLATQTFSQSGKETFIKLAIETLAILYIFLNTRQFRKAPALTVIISVWFVWMVTRSFFMLPYYESIRRWGSMDFMPVMYWPLIYLVMYFYARENPKAIKWTILLFMTLMATTSYLFVYIFRDIYAYSDNFVQNSIVFNIIVIFPWLLISEYRLVRYLGIIAMSVLAVYSLKRSIITALVLSLVSYFFGGIIFNRQRKHLFKTIVMITLLAVSLAFAYRYSNILVWNAMTKRLELISEDEGSGRLSIYKDYIAELKNESFAKLMVGRGHNASTQFYGTTTHNDFLEVMFAYGINGLVLYICLHLCLIHNCYRLIRIRSSYAEVWVASYAICFILSLVSHLVIYPHFGHLMALWGTIQGCLHSRSNVSLSENRRLCLH